MAKRHLKVAGAFSYRTASPGGSSMSRIEGLETVPDSRTPTARRGVPEGQGKIAGGQRGTSAAPGTVGRRIVRAPAGRGLERGAERPRVPHTPPSGGLRRRLPATLRVALFLPSHSRGPRSCLACPRLFSLVPPGPSVAPRPASHTAKAPVLPSLRPAKSNPRHLSGTPGCTSAPGPVGSDAGPGSASCATGISARIAR